MIEITEHMVRILRLRVLRCVAGIAVRVRELVVAVHMALDARHSHVRPRQREIRRGVVERRRLPGSLRVACQTIMTELSLLMIRIGGGVVIPRVAVPTRVRQILILIIDVTLIAGNRLMRADELERRVGVIECRRAPHRRRMARRAILTETGQHVTRVCRLVVIRLMAGVAVRVHELVVAVHVALCALRRRVRSRQGEVRRGMIE
jgi:hypothetical protein